MEFCGFTRKHVHRGKAFDSGTTQKVWSVIGASLGTSKWLPSRYPLKAPSGSIGSIEKITMIDSQDNFQISIHHVKHVVCSALHESKT